MWQANFEHHGTMDMGTAPMQKVLKLLSTFDWDRQIYDRPYALAGSKVIFYTHFTANDAFDDAYKRKWPAEAIVLRSSTFFILKHVQSLFPDHLYIKGELSCAPPGIEQGWHVDPRRFHRYARRVHIPLVTAPEAKLELRDAALHIRAGEIVSFNNLRSHRSVNFSTINRVHVIVDLMPKAVHAALVEKVGAQRVYESVPDEWLGDPL